MSPSLSGRSHALLTEILSPRNLGRMRRLKDFWNRPKPWTKSSTLNAMNLPRQKEGSLCRNGLGQREVR
jgi:hypothetical protein